MTYLVKVQGRLQGVEAVEAPTPEEACDKAVEQFSTRHPEVLDPEVFSVTSQAWESNHD